MSSDARDRSSPEVRLESEGDGQRLVVRGRLDSRTVGRMWRETSRALAAIAPTALVVDAAGIDYCDISGVGYLVDLRRRQQAAGMAFEIRDLQEDYGRLLAMFPGEETAAPEKAHSGFRTYFEGAGRATFEVVENIRDLVEFLGHISAAMAKMATRRVRLRWGDMMQVAEAAGVNALPVCCMMGFVIGVIISFQGAMSLRRFAAEIYTPDMVVLAMFREMGPLFTAIILAGRSGSAFAAEIGTMKVREEIDALTTMGLDPVSFLAVPRVLAGIVVTPLLTAFANLAGLIGGALVFMSFDFTLETYVNRVLLRGDLIQLLGGLTKALFFGVIVAGVGCLEGLRTGSGARAVGESTTRSVVSSIVLIILADGLFGVAYYFLGI